MWILRWHLTKEVFLVTLVVLLTLLSVILLFILIDEFGDLNQSYTASNALVYVILQMPRWTVQIFPLAMMIGAVFALGRLADQSELTVIRSAGVSANKILYSVLAAGLIPIAAMLLMAEFVVPVSEFSAKNIYNTAHNRSVFQKTRYGIWLRHADDFFHIKKMQSASSMSEVKYYKYDNNKLNQIVSATSARLDKSGLWSLYKPKTITFTDTRLIDSQENILSIKTDMSPEIIQQVQIEPQTQSSNDLLEQRHYLVQNSLDTSEVDYALWARISYPFVTALMLFLAFPFAFGSNRVSSASQRMFVGIMVGLGFFIVSRVFEQIGLLYFMPGWIAYFVPIALFFSFGLFLYRRV